jgi:hypothetical protein
MAVQLEERVTNLEDLMADVLRAQARTQRNLDQLTLEMRDFKNEMRTSFDRYQKESHHEIREMRKQWGELSNRMGTMAEDLVAPSIPRILQTVLGCPEDTIDSIAVRVRRRHETQPEFIQEFDVVATCGEFLLINETKSSLAPEKIKEFIERLAEVRAYFPEHKDKKVIGAIASLYVDPSLVRYGERQGLIVLGFGEDLMDVLNTPGFTPQSY